jgi:outer membrane protein assembly factor BamB
MRKTIVRAVIGLGIALACAVPAVTSPSPAQAVGPGDWPTYHLDNLRSGYQTKASPIGTPAVQWTATLDGNVYGEPLVVNGMVLAATENDTVYALNRSTGAIIWSQHVGSPEPAADLQCGDIDPSGITSTMVYDPNNNLVYAVAEELGATHFLYGINLSSGAIQVQQEVEPPVGDSTAHQQRGALTLLNGRVYIPYGGAFGDCGQYIGQVISVNESGASMQSYAVPTTREAGIWEPAGGVVEPNGNLLYVSGNGAAAGTGATYDGSDSVIELSPSLKQTDLFAPSDWATQNNADDDLSSMNASLVGGYIYANGKAGVGYVLQPGHLGGVGGQIAELSSNNCQPFGGSAVVGSTVYLPCSSGPQAVSIASNGTPTQLWKSTAPAAGSPVVGGGAVWTVDFNGGDLYALNPSTGATLAEVHIGQCPSYITPTLVGNQVFVGTKTGIVAVTGA